MNLKFWYCELCNRSLVPLCKHHIHKLSLFNDCECVCIAFPIFASSKQTRNLQKYCSHTVSSFKTRYVKYSLPHFPFDTFCVMHASCSSVQCRHRKPTTHRCALSIYGHPLELISIISYTVNCCTDASPRVKSASRMWPSL